MNPYTHLRTLLDDKSKHAELCARLWCAVSGNEFSCDQVCGDTIYTTNLDALLPLWPEGWRFILDSGIYTNVCRALIYGGQELGSTTQTTPALAMLDCLLQVLEYEWDNRSVELSGADIDKCPQCGGHADNGHDRELPPNPYVCTKCEERDE